MAGLFGCKNAAGVCRPQRLGWLFALFVVLAVILASLSPSALAADVAPGRVPTVTRLVKLFSELETTLATSIQSGNSAAAQKLLTDDFEMRVGAMPGNPTPRAEWLRQSIAKPGPSYRIEQMAVHDFGDTAVVSFLQAADAAASAKNIFTVDVWRRADGQWKLATRYAGPAGSSEFVIPGTSTEPVIEKKY